MEYPTGATGLKFYHAYPSLKKIENSVIDFDVRNIAKVLPGRSKRNAEIVTNRINSRYLNSHLHIKRSFGNKYEDDFQQYNWGLSLNADMGLETDKAELLMVVYCRIVEGRLTEKEMDMLLMVHTSFKHIPAKEKRGRRRDIKTSWRMHAMKKLGCPPSISKKQFLTILDANEILIAIDVEQLSRDMMALDNEADYLHGLLLDDPLLKGEVPPKRKYCEYRPFEVQADHGDEVDMFDEDSSMDDFIDHYRRKLEAEEKKLLPIVQKRETEKPPDDTAKNKKKHLIEVSEAVRMEMENPKRQALAEKIQRIKRTGSAEYTGPPRPLSPSPVAVSRASTPKEPARRPFSAGHRSPSCLSPQRSSRPLSAEPAKKAPVMKRIPLDRSLSTNKAKLVPSVPTKKRSKFDKPLPVLPPIPMPDWLHQKERQGEPTIIKEASGMVSESAQSKQPTAIRDPKESVELTSEPPPMVAAAALVRPHASNDALMQIIPDTPSSARKPPVVPTSKPTETVLTPPQHAPTYDSQSKEDESVQSSEVILSEKVSVQDVQEIPLESRRGSKRVSISDVVDVALIPPPVTVHRDSGTISSDEAAPRDVVPLEPEVRAEHIRQEDDDFSEITADFATVQLGTDDSRSMRVDWDESSLNTFVITDTIKPPEFFPDLFTLFSLPADELEFMVPKTEGELRILLRHDDEGTAFGIFVHGFRPMSNAEAQGLVHIGDELVEINRVDVRGKTLEDVIAALDGHTANEVQMKVKRRDIAMAVDIAASQTEDASVVLSPRPYVIKEDVQQPAFFPSVHELLALPSQELAFIVPKTNGELRIQLRQDEEDGILSIFVHGFRPFSNAEKQGLVKIGDELIAIEDVDVQGQSLEFVVDLLKDHTEENVHMTVCRRAALEELLKYEEYFSPRPGTSDVRSCGPSRRQTPRSSTPSSQTPRSETKTPRSEVSISSSLSNGKFKCYQTVEIDVLCPRSFDGKLRLLMKNNDDGSARGLFIYGFAPRCRAEEAGLLQIGDEITAVNGIDVKGKQLKDLMDALAQQSGITVPIKILRSMPLSSKR